MTRLSNKLTYSSGWVEFTYHELRMMLAAIRVYPMPDRHLAERKRDIIKKIKNEVKYLETQNKRGK